jgi:hypothetical protein
MGSSFFGRRIKRLERHITGGDAESSGRDFSKDNARRSEMKDEFSEMSEEVKQKCLHIEELLNDKNKFLTNDAVEAEFTTSDSIISYYNRYQRYIDKDRKIRIKALIEGFTRQKRSWYEVKKESGSQMKRFVTIYAIEQFMKDINTMRYQTLEYIHAFLLIMRDELIDQMIPERILHAQFHKEDEEEWKRAMDQRWESLFQERNMTDATVPDYDSDEWGQFTSQEHSRILEEKKLALDSRDAELISDIMAGGKNYDIKVGDKDSPKYKDHMQDIYNRFQTFLIDHREWKSAMDQRWESLFQERNMTDATVPDYASKEWKAFKEKEYSNILDAKVPKHNLGVTHVPRENFVLSEIILGIRDDNINETDRHSQEYKDYMQDIYERFQVFLKVQGKKAQASD